MEAEVQEKVSLRHGHSIPLLCTCSGGWRHVPSHSPPPPFDSLNHAPVLPAEPSSVRCSVCGRFGTLNRP